MSRVCSKDGENENLYRALMGKPEGIPIRGLEDNINMCLREIG
jgi:hypothetical protein